MDLTNLKALLTDDDAVSPVIGVILMVAITVILAAVIASFVLGLGDQAQQATPQASFSFNYDESTGPADQGVVTITHDGGDTIDGNTLYVRGSGFADGDSGSDDWNSTGGINIVSENSTQAWSGHTGESEITAGLDIKAAANNDYDFRIVYESQEGDNSATLGQDSGPEA